MKNYKEMADSVFKRSDAIIKKKSERRRTMRLITSMLSCLLFVALLGAGALSGVFNRFPFETPDAGTSQQQSTESNGMQPSQGANTKNPSNGDAQGNSDDKTLISADDPRIVWAERMSSDNGLGNWNGKRIGSELYEALSYHSDDTVFAIVAQAVGGRNREYCQYVYNGKTLIEYEKEAEEESELSEKLVRLLKCGDDLKYGEALYKTGNDKGRKWSKEHYDSEVAYFGEELLSKYIVDGVFLREKLEYDCNQPVTVTARTAWHKAYEAYKNHIIQQTKEHLTEQGVVFESKSAVYYANVIKYPVGNLASEDAYIEIETSKPYLIIYISKEKFASLAGNYEFNVFYLADKSARNGVLSSGSTDLDLPLDTDLPTDLVN